jgi:SAM-dependent methyltransferase
MRFRKLLVCSSLLIATLAASILAAQSAQPRRKPDVPYVPTTDLAVAAMLKLADVKKGDVVYDLGCGDGRIVIAAAKQLGARGVGIDINPERIREANENARKAGVEKLVRFEENDLFEADIRAASVVTLFLLPEINLKLRPKLLRDLKPGTRIVSNTFDMADWKPDKESTVGDPADPDFPFSHTLLLWTVPARAGK